MFESRPLKVLYMSSRPDVGAGGETYLLLLFKYLDRDQLQPFVVLPEEGTLDGAVKALGAKTTVSGVRYNWLQPDEPWFKLLSGAEDRVKALAEYIKENEIDLVHTNSNYRLEGALAARLAGVPHLYLAHIEFDPKIPLFKKLSLTQATYSSLMAELSDRIVAVSESVASTMRPHLPNNLLSVIHNGVDMDRYDEALTRDPKVIRESLGIPENSVLVASVGRITYDKGFDYLLEAAHKVLRQPEQEVHFVLAGNLENVQFSKLIQDKIAELDIASNFHLLGHRSDVPDILAAADVFVLSSRKEGHPYVLLEALASNCAAVATNCGGVEETIEDGISGFVVPVGDVDGMSERILRYVRDDDLRSDHAAKARKLVEDNFSAKKSAETLLEAYQGMTQADAKKSGSLSVELFLDLCTNLGHVGSMQVEMEKRLRRVEGIAEKLHNNRIYKLLRRFRRSGQS